MCVYAILFISSSVYGDLRCFCLLAVVNNAALNMGVQMSLQDPAFNPFGYVPRSGIAEAYGNSIFTFWRKLHTVFYRGCSILHSLKAIVLFITDYIN